MIVPVSVRDDDPRLAVYRNLKQSNLTRWSGLFVAEGDKVVDRLLVSGLDIVSVLVGRRWLDEYEPKVSGDTPLLVIDDAEIPELVGFEFHRGVLACGRRPVDTPLEIIAPADRRRWTLVVCPEIFGPENLGNLLRTCAALGVDGVLLGNQAADPYSRRVLRVSMGEAFRVPMRQSSDLAGDLATLVARDNLELAATVLDPEATPLSSFARPERLGVLFGGEGDGLSGEWLSRCKHRLTIPMARGVDSLNVATAAGVFIYELTQAANRA